jgi:hypothetical protein
MRMMRRGRFTKVLTVVLLCLLSSRGTFAFHQFHHGSGALLITGTADGHNHFSCARRPRTNDKSRLTFLHDAPKRRHGSSSSSSSPSALFQIPKGSDANNGNNSGAYSDDCFGLLSLLGGVATQDGIFVAIFVVLSTIAATLTNLGSIPASRRVPGIVAAFTLVCTLALTSDGGNDFLSSSLTDIFGYTQPTANPDAPLIEMALCAFSLIYSLFGSKDS